MNKILEGAKRAVEVAKCDHNHVPLPRPQSITPPRFDKFYCNKCDAVFWIPIEPVTNGYRAEGE